MILVETLRQTNLFCLRRRGRFLIVELLAPHRVLSTSTCNGGEQERLRFLVNHQSCEGADHRERHSAMVDGGLERYHDEACAEAGVAGKQTAMMGTAANMNNVAVAERRGESVSVTAIVTGGVQGNATCAGDAAAWRETETGWSKIPIYAGTINTMVLVSHPMTAGALARSAMTITEGKTAALQQLAVRSLYSKDLATGTGTDQYCLAAPLQGGKALTTASTHVELGELMAVAVRDATLEALRWQNGLEASYTRGLLHAMGRYGVRSQEEFVRAMEARLSDRQSELLRKNVQAVLFEPTVAAAVYAFCAVLDRVRYGTIPEMAATEVLRQQATLIAVNLAARSELWAEFYTKLALGDGARRGELVLDALALGWSAKWS